MKLIKYSSSLISTSIYFSAPVLGGISHQRITRTQWFGVLAHCDFFTYTSRRDSAGLLACTSRGNSVVYVNESTYFYFHLEQFL